MTIAKRTLIRFWNKVDIKGLDDCWEWKACTVGGYGAFWDGSSFKRAHRISYEISNGSIPLNKLILHKCDNRLCINPNHLYCGTYSDNVLDREDRNSGSAGNPKLYAGEIELIKRLCIELNPKPCTSNRYKFSATLVSKMFKVSVSTISNIWNSNRFLCKEGYYVV